MLFTGKKIFLDGINYQYYSKHTDIFNIDDLNSNIFDSVLDIKSQKRNYNFIHQKENYQDYINNLEKFFATC